MAVTDTRPRLAGILCALLLLGGCSFVDQALLPSLTGEYGDSAPRSGVLLLGGTDFETPDIDDAEPSRTPAGQRVRALRGDLVVLKEHIDLTNRVLQRLRTELRDAASDYEERRDALRDDLRRRTPPTPAEIAERRQGAEAALNQVAQSIEQLRNLLKEASSNSAEAGALAESATLAASALDVQEGDDQEQLLVLQDETTRMAAVGYRLQSEMSEDIVQASDFLLTQRALLAQLAPGGDAELPVLTGGLPADQPLVIIRFDRPDVDYASIVDETVTQALQGRPNARVQLVAVAPETGADPAAPQRARERLKKVLDTLVAAGVPADRIDLSARTSPDVAVDEVQIFVR